MTQSCPRLYLQYLTGHPKMATSLDLAPIRYQHRTNQMRPEPIQDRRSDLASVPKMHRGITISIIIIILLAFIATAHGTNLISSSELTSYVRSKTNIICLAVAACFIIGISGILNNILYYACTAGVLLLILAWADYYIKSPGTDSRAK